MSTNYNNSQDRIVMLDKSATEVVNTRAIRASVAITPTVTADGHVAGDVIGGILTFANALRMAGGTAMVVDAQVHCKIGGYTTGAFDLFLFSKLPTGTYTDSAAFALDAADLPNLLHVRHLADFSNGGAAAACYQEAAPTRRPVFNNETTVLASIYGILVTRTATLNLTGTADVTAIIDLEQDQQDKYDYC